MAADNVVIERKEDFRVGSLPLLPPGAVPQGRRVARSAVAAVPAVRVYVLAPSKQATEERDLGRLRRLRIDSAQCGRNLRGWRLAWRRDFAMRRIQQPS